MGDGENIRDLSGIRFQSIRQADVPKGRDGKHKRIISQLLSDISRLEDGHALKIPLAELPDTKENIRSALSRAARLKQLDLATSSDERNLFVWKAAKRSRNGGNGKS